jgi:hypothetical protein
MPTASSEPSYSSPAPSQHPAVAKQASPSSTMHPLVSPISSPAPSQVTSPGVFVNSENFELRYQPQVSRFTLSTLPELEQVTSKYLDFYLGLAFASPTMADKVSFSITSVRQTSFSSLEGTDFTDVTFNVNATFNPTSAEPMIPDTDMITRMVQDAFTNDDWMDVYISRLRGLPDDNWFRSSTSVDYLPTRNET